MRRSQSPRVISVMIGPLHFPLCRLHVLLTYDHHLEKRADRVLEQPVSPQICPSSLGKSELWPWPLRETWCTMANGEVRELSFRHQLSI